MTSFREKPHATNIALYPMMFPYTAWWNYELPFSYRYCILDIILLELVLSFPFFHNWKDLHQWFRSTMSHNCTVSEALSYSSLSWIISWSIVTCSSEQVSSFFSCRWLYVIFPTIQMHLYGYKHFIRHIHNGKFLCINIWSCNYFSQYNIHPYITETFLDSFHLYQDKF